MTDQFDHGYALLIGVTENQVLDWALPDVARDVAALREILIHSDRCAYPSEHVKVVTGHEATRNGILEGIEWLQEQISNDGSDDATAVILYTGHGFRDFASDFYLIPYDVKKGKIQSRGLRAQAFAEAIGELRPRRLLVILDCCHAGGMGVKGIDAPEGYISTALPPAKLMPERKSITGTRGWDALTHGHGRAVLSSSTGEQESYIRRGREMSIFTYHLIEALTGHAQPEGGAKEVLVSDVISYVTRNVPKSAMADWQKKQEPEYHFRGSNFPVALLLGGKGLGAGQPAPDPRTLLFRTGRRTSYHAELKGGGGIAQGPGAVAAGERGVAIGGDVQNSVIITGDSDG